MLYNGVGWVDKPNVSDGLWACWAFNPTYPLCHFFYALHYTALWRADAQIGKQVPDPIILLTFAAQGLSLTKAV